MSFSCCSLHFASPLPAKVILHYWVCWWTVCRVVTQTWSLKPCPGLQTTSKIALPQFWQQHSKIQSSHDFKNGNRFGPLVLAVPESTSEGRPPKRQPGLGRGPVQNVRKCLNNLWNKLGYVVPNFTDSSISIIHWPACVATCLQSTQPFIRKNCSNLFVQFIAGRPAVPLPIGCQCSIRRTQCSYGRLMYV